MKNISYMRHRDRLLDFTHKPQAALGLCKILFLKRSLRRSFTSGIPCGRNTTVHLQEPREKKSCYVARTAGTELYLVLEGMFKTIRKSISSSHSQAWGFVHRRQHIWHKFILLSTSVLVSIVSLAERNDFVEASFKIT